MFMSARNHILMLSLLFVLIHSLLFWHYGIRVFFDSAAYLEAADYIIMHGELQDLHHLFYTVPILIMTAIRLLFPGEIIPILLFQCFLSWVATIFLYKSAVTIFNSRMAGLMAGVIFLLWLDNIHWNITTMTESIACSIYCFVVYVLSRWQDRPKDIFRLAILLVFAFFSRPTGIVIIIGVFVFLIAHHWGTLREKRPMLIAIALIGTILIVFSADRMLDHWNFTEQYMKGNIITYADVVKDRPLFHESLTIDPPPSKTFSTSKSPIGRIVSFIYDNPIYFLKTASLKVSYLVAFVRPYYSWSHNIYLMLWISFVYVSFVLGWRTTTNLPVKIFAAATIILNCGLIAISSVDWDNRFYIPMEPGIVLLAGGGAAMLVRWIRVMRSGSVVKTT